MLLGHDIVSKKTGQTLGPTEPKWGGNSWKSGGEWIEISTQVGCKCVRVWKQFFGWNVFRRQGLWRPIRVDGNWGSKTCIVALRFQKYCIVHIFWHMKCCSPPYLHISLRISCASVNICFQHYIFTDPILGYKFSNGRFSISAAWLLHSCAIIIIATINLNEYILLIIPVYILVDATFSH